MPEQSHLEEMRDRIRGDRERAAKRAAAPIVPPAAPAAPPAEAAPPPPPGLLDRVRRVFARG
jgi:hypothetical protein